MGEDKPKVRPLFPSEPAPRAPAAPEATKPSVLKFGPEMEYEADWDPATSTLKERPGTRKSDYPAALKFDPPKQSHAPNCDCLTCRARRFRAGPAAPLFVPEPVQAATSPVAATLKMDGMTIRHRIEVPLDVLRAKNPDVPSEAVLQSARSTLLLVNLEDSSTTSSLLEIGLLVQEEFAGISGRMLALTTSKKLDSVNQGLRGIGQKLAAAALESLFSEPHGLRKLLGGAPSIEEVKTNLKAVVVEVQIRCTDLKSGVDDLRGLRTEAASIGDDLEKILPQIEAELVVARFLIDHLLATPEKEFYKEWADALQRRVDSIVMTRVTLRQALLQLQMVKQHLQRLTETVYTALVNLVPAWCGNCVSFLSRARLDKDDSTTRSDLGALTALRDRIVDILKVED